VFLQKIAQSSHFSVSFIIPLMLILALLVVVDQASFLSMVGEYGLDIPAYDETSTESETSSVIQPSAQEIMLHSVYGINTYGRKNIVDIVGVALPYLFLVFAGGLLLTVMTEPGSRFLYVIRHRTYTKWLLRNLTRIVLWLVALWTLFYAATGVFSLLLSDNRDGLGPIFYHLNAAASHDASFHQVIVSQYVLGCLVCLMIAASQFMLSVVLKDASKGYIYLNAAILFCVFIGIFDIYNPLMMSKHNSLNLRIGASPFVTGAVLLGLAILCTVLNKECLRRKGL